jgi:hypothetical protein
MLRVTRAVSPAVAFCRLACALRTSFTCAVAAPVLKNTVTGLHHRSSLTKSGANGSGSAGFFKQRKAETSARGERSVVPENIASDVQ